MLMATIQKTVLKRFNGTDWDPVYLANSADISYLGRAIQIAKASGDGYVNGETINATETSVDVLEKVINILAKLREDTVPAITSGESITSLAASKISGVLARTQLPADVSGKGVEVESEVEKNGLTSDDVNVGDIVKVTGGKVYLVTDTTDTVTYMELSDSASTVAWSRVTGTPTTLAGYGITDAVNASEKVTSATPANVGKILTLNAEGKLDVSVTGDAATLGGYEAAHFATKSEHDALSGQVTTQGGQIAQLETDVKNIDASWIKSGMIDIARIPAAALARLYVAENAAALATLTTEQVQNGDTVKVQDSGKMYYVIDDTKLGTGDYMQAFTEYTAGAASAVDWSGVTSKPTTVDGYGITDAVKTTDLVDSAIGNAGKVLKINAEGKLAASITGDAATLGGHNAAYFATAESVTTLQGTVSSNTGKITALETAVGNAGSGLVKDVADLKAADLTIQGDITNLKNGSAITALEASKLTGTVARTNLPSDISGRLFEKADLEEAKTTLTSVTASVGDLVKLANGQVYVIVDSSNLSADEGYELIVGGDGVHVSWANVQDKPTTISGYGITDGVTTAMLADSATGNVGKILKVNADSKLDTSITGDAATLGGNAPAHYATADSVTQLGSRMDAAEGEIDQLQTDVKNIDASWLTAGTIPIDRLPKGALERCVVVADDEARFALTTATVQTGDTVKVQDSGKMYFVKDDTKLSTEEGYEVYTAGTAAAVEWSGVQNKPTTLTGYGITDAVAASEKVTEANAGNAGKILVLNAQGKLDVSITGHVDWANVDNKPTSTAQQIDDAVAAAEHLNRATLDKLGESAGALTYNGAAMATKAEVEQAALGLRIVENGSLPGDAAEGQMVLEKI